MMRDMGGIENSVVLPDGEHGIVHHATASSVEVVQPWKLLAARSRSVDVRAVAGAGGGTVSVLYAMVRLGLTNRDIYAMRQRVLDAIQSVNADLIASFGGAR